VLVFERRHGISLVFAGLVAASAMLLVLALVDAATLLLPDALTFPLLWLGLACAWVRGPLFLHESVAGVIAGYGFLRLLFWLYWCVRKRQGMGQGDFKLLAALGAWVGLERLPYVLLAACLLGVLFACLRQKRLDLSASYPFGPFLAISGMGVLLTGPEVHSYFWR
jgi:leader peptidase (prepilin peptidase)/N-methyltransferase